MACNVDAKDQGHLMSLVTSVYCRSKQPFARVLGVQVLLFSFSAQQKPATVVPMDMIDAIFVAVVLMLATGTVLSARAVWRWLSPTGIQPSSHKKMSMSDAATKTGLPAEHFPILSSCWLYTTAHGTKWHLFADCGRIASTTTMSWEGMCKTCWNRFAKTTGIPPWSHKKMSMSDAATKTGVPVDQFPALSSSRLYTTDHGTKWHLFADCGHIASKTIISREGMCKTCWNRFAKTM